MKRGKERDEEPVRHKGCYKERVKGEGRENKLKHMMETSEEYCLDEEREVAPSKRERKGKTEIGTREGLSDRGQVHWLPNTR